MANYAVQVADGATGRIEERMITAATLAGAEEVARAQGWNVRGVRIVEESGGAARGEPEVRPYGTEEVVWEDSPSQWENAGWFALCLLVLPIPYAIYRAVATRSTRMTLTSQRLKLEWGVLSKSYDQVELYRVKDFILARSFWQRVAGLGTVTLVTSDHTMPEVRLKNIKDSERVRELLRAHVERTRRLRGVRELDVSDDTAGALGLH